MKKIMFLIITFMCSINYVYADCSSEDIKKYKTQVENVEITYMVREPELGEFGMINGIIDLIIQNLPEGFYIYSSYYDSNYYVSDWEDGIIYMYDHLYGNYSFDIYSEFCPSKKVKSIQFKVPRYNPYSEDELCNDITEGALDVCEPWYDYDLDYDTFVQKVEEYKNKHIPKPEEKPNWFTQLLNDIMIFASTYSIYIMSGIVVLVIIITMVIINRKRGRLEWKSFC